jgi:transposase
MNLIQLFTHDLPPAQRLYEAIRAFAFGEGALEDIAKRFDYSPNSLNTIIYRVKNGHQKIFPDVKKGPKKRRTSQELMKLIQDLRRNKKLSSRDIVIELKQQSIDIGVRTVERILAEAGFPKLRRRTHEQRGVSKKGTVLPLRCSHIDFDELKPFHIDCKVAGVFFFLPYILESGILDIVSQCPLPESADVGNRQAALSMLLLKLIGNERLSHVKQYDAEIGFGIFAGLNVLPKSSWMCSYSCRMSESRVMDFQKRIIENFRKIYPDMYSNGIINLDFHAIPHFGDESQMERVWCGARGKAMKGANTFFAQDGSSNHIIYSRADIKRKDSSEEIKNFVKYWIDIKGVVNETLVFDSKLTRYEILYDLDRDNIKFLTLRIRNRALLKSVQEIPDEQWDKVYLPIPKRKYKHVRVHENSVVLIKGQKAFRQVIIKDHGRAEPTFIISNNDDFKLKDLLVIYAKRWHIENKLAELIKFFSLNSLSSPIMIRIHFDILWTIIADTLYRLFARDLKRFEDKQAPTIFRQFINMPGVVSYDGKNFTVRIRKRATTPILMGIDKLNREIQIPWLDNRMLKIVWTA